MRFDFDRITLFTHQILADYLTDGDTAVDATCGNGLDTLFLSNKVGSKGKVLALDIQPKSIENTREKISNESLYPHNVVLVKDSHERLKQIVKEYGLDLPKVIMFNLGYLPGNKEGSRTKKETTLEAIIQSVEILAPGGIISVIFYPHDSGREEWEYCREYIENLTGEYDSFMFKRINRSQPPFLVLITKK